MLHHQKKRRWDAFRRHKQRRVEPTERPTHARVPPDPARELVEADSIRDGGRTVALIGTALVMNRPRDIVVRRRPAEA